MITIDKLLQKIPSLNSAERRSHLAKLMQELMSDNKNCFNCSGVCCSYAHNSMLITPLEGLEIVLFLQKERRIDDSLILKLDDSIAQFRLDRELSIGRGREFRRNYTCPFYDEGPRGCSISRNSKPYGCLGFNPGKVNTSGEDGCRSYSEVLEGREKTNEPFETSLNQLIQKELALAWEKKSIPVAIKEILNKLS